MLTCTITQSCAVQVKGKCWTHEEKWRWRELTLQPNKPSPCTKPPASGPGLCDQGHVRSVRNSHSDLLWMILLNHHHWVYISNIIMQPMNYLFLAVKVKYPHWLKSKYPYWPTTSLYMYEMVWSCLQSIRKVFSFRLYMRQNYSDHKVA